MSRKIDKRRNWGRVLRKMRIDAGLTQDQIAKAIYGGEGKGNVSEIEKGKLPITEEKIRLWVERCGRSMQEFYVLATGFETITFIRDRLGIPKESH